MEDRYTYHIHPHKTITNILPGKGIRKPMGLKLTQEEVLKCLACGPVYRVFPGIPPIRVTGSNLKNLHVSLDEYLKNEDKLTNTSNPTEKVVEEPILEVEAAETPKNDTLTEEIEEENTIVEENNTEDSVVEEDTFEKKLTDLKAKEVVFEGTPVPPTEEVEEEEVDESVEDAEEEIEELEDDEEEEVEVPSTPTTDQNGHVISSQPQYKKKKKRH